MTWCSGDLVVEARRGDATVERGAHGRPVLDGRYDWVVTGPPAILSLLEQELASHAEHLGTALVLTFGNTVGWFQGTGIGAFEVSSGKWTCRDFDRMLLDIGRVAANLPFGREAGGWMFERDQRVDRQVLLHQFIYVRSVLDGDVRADDAMIPAMRQVLADPHRKLERHSRRTPLERCSSIRPQELLRIASGANPLVDAGVCQNAISARLGGRLPIEVEKQESIVVYDTSENRFVRALLAELELILDEVEGAFSNAPRGVARGIHEEATRLRGLLAPFRRARLWENVGRLDRPVANSPVLHRKAGYRTCMIVHSRLRLGSRVPPLPASLDRILALRDIAELYEIWCYFRFAEALSAALGPPVSADCPSASATQLEVTHGFRINYTCGSELSYNARFSRGSGDRHSYSLQLRPDIALNLRSGRHPGLHLLDAKFRVRNLATASFDEVDGDETYATKSFKRADVHKMHAYKDAIRAARTAWVLFPGQANQFWSDGDFASGVGAAAFQPDGDASAEFVLSKLL